MKRKWLMVFLCICTVAMAGCGKKESESTVAANAGQEETTASAESAQSADTEESVLPENAGVYEKEALPDFITDVVKAEDTSYENPVPLGTWVEIGKDDSPVYTNLDYEVTKACYLRVNKVTDIAEDTDYVNDFLDAYEAANEEDNEFSAFGRKYYTGGNYNFYLVDFEYYIPSHFADDSVWLPQYQEIADAAGDNIGGSSGIRWLHMPDDTDTTTYPGTHIVAKGYFQFINKQDIDTGLSNARWEVPSMPDGVAYTLVNNPDYKPGASSDSISSPYIYVYSKELPESMDAYLALVADEEADTAVDGETAEEPETLDSQNE